MLVTFASDLSLRVKLRCLRCRALQWSCRLQPTHSLLARAPVFCGCSPKTHECVLRARVPREQNAESCVAVLWCGVDVSRCGVCTFRLVIPLHPSAASSADAGTGFTGRLSPATRAVPHMLFMTLSLVVAFPSVNTSLQHFGVISSTSPGSSSSRREKQATSLLRAAITSSAWRLEMICKQCGFSWHGGSIVPLRVCDRSGNGVRLTVFGSTGSSARCMRLKPDSCCLDAMTQVPHSAGRSS